MYGIARHRGWKLSFVHDATFLIYLFSEWPICILDIQPYAWRAINNNILCDSSTFLRFPCPVSIIPHLFGRRICGPMKKAHLLRFPSIGPHSHSENYCTGAKRETRNRIGPESENLHEAQVRSLRIVWVLNRPRYVGVLWSLFVIGHLWFEWFLPRLCSSEQTDTSKTRV